MGQSLERSISISLMIGNALCLDVACLILVDRFLCKASTGFASLIDVNFRYASGSDGTRGASECNIPRTSEMKSFPAVVDSGKNRNWFANRRILTSG
jgi:hypothetical protein